MGTERRSPPGTLYVDPSGSPHWGAPFTEEPLLSTEERPLHRGAPTPRTEEPGCGLPAAPPTPPVLQVTARFLRVQLFHTSCPVADSSHRRSVGTPGVPPASLPPDSTPAPQPQFPGTLGQTRILAFCSHCWSPPHGPPEQGPGCPFPLPPACSWEPAHSQAWAMVTHQSQGCLETFLTWTLRA